MSSTRVGLVGFGYWGNNLARNVVAARGLDLVAIADGDAGRLDRARDDYPGVDLLSDLGAVLARDDIEAVIIATPAATHVEMACQALATGRHILVEKPAALDVAGATRIADEADRCGRVAMVGHTFLYSPAVERLKDLVAAGDLGELRYIDSRRLLGQARADCNVLWDLGAHDVSILLEVLGEMPARVMGRMYAHMSIGQQDTCYANLEWPSGVDASLQLSWVNPQKVRHLTLVGTRRMAIYDDVPLSQKVTVHGAGLDDAEAVLTGAVADDASPFGRMDLRTSAGDVFIPGLSAEEPLLREVSDLAAACAGRSVPRASARFGLKVVAVLEAIARSAAEGGSPVEVQTV